MGSILSLLTSPEWWFTAVAVSVPVGIFSAYMKEWLSSALASISQRYSLYRQKKKLQRDKVVAFLVREPQLLLLEYVRFGTQFIAYLSLAALAFAVPAYMVLIRHSPEAAPLSMFFSATHPTADEIRNSAVAGGLLNMALLLGLLVLQYRLAQQASICKVARRQLHKNAARRHARPPA